MEYSNSGTNVISTIKSMLSVVIFGFVLLVLLKGIFLLIPAVLISWVGYKIIKIMMNKFSELSGNEAVNNVETNEIFEEDVTDIFGADVIDVDYEELNK